MFLLFFLSHCHTFCQALIIFHMGLSNGLLILNLSSKVSPYYIVSFQLIILKHSY